MKKIGLWIGLLLIVALPLLQTRLAEAGVNDFTIHSFESDETLTRNDPQGELHVVEHIQLTFSDYNHGIIRAIPAKYKNHSLQLHVNSIRSDSGAATSYTTASSNGNTILKIGDANRTVTGDQSYTIDYTLRNVLSFYKDHTELYWDVNGDQWGQSFDAVSLKLHLPSATHAFRQPVCFTGSFNSSASQCSITEDGAELSAATTAPINAGQTLTYVAGFQNGYFTPPNKFDTVREYAVVIAKVAVLPLLALLGAGGWWLKRGRDSKGSGIIVPSYGPTKGLVPLDIGTIIDFNVDNRDITATIIDLAIRGYLKIIETRQDRLMLSDKLNYQLELVNIDLTALNASERTLLSALFDSITVGASVDLSTSQSKLYTVATALRQATYDRLTAAGYFRDNPKNAKQLAGLAVVIFVAIYVLHGILGFALVVGLVLAALIIKLFANIMPARTALGVTVKEQALGLKMYLNIAEKDRLNKLQSPGAAYAAGASEPVKTVELFEKLLPYAIVLGVEKGWASQFDGLYQQPPGWYSGNWTTFNALYFTSSLNSGIGKAVNTAFSPPSNAGGSGFGGGGFAGGGGGGGGGGGW